MLSAFKVKHVPISFRVLLAPSVPLALLVSLEIR